MRRDYLTTFVTEAAVVASYLLVFRLVAQHFGSTGFGEYALARRTLSFLSPLAVLGLDVAMARYVAYAVGRRRDFASYAPAALGLMTAALAVVGALLLLLQGPLSTLFFGSDAYRYLVPPLAVLLLGADVQVIAYGYLRGRVLVQRANLLMLVTQALLPLAAVLLFGDSVSEVLYVLGLGWLVFGGIALLTSPLSLKDFRGHVAELARFGLPRVPGDLFQFALFAAPAVAVAHEADLRVAGLVAFGIAAIGMVGSILSPVSFILLPVAARSYADGSAEDLHRHARQIARLVMAGLIAGIILIEVFAEQLVVAYLGPRFAEGANILRVLVTAAFPWGLYISMKSLVDARHERALNARSMAIAFAVFLVLATAARLFSPAPLGVILAFVISLYVLALLTLREVRRAVEMPADRIAEAGADGAQAISS